MGWFLLLFLGVFVTWVAGGVFLGIRIGGEVSLLPSQGVLCFWWLAAHVGVFINLFRLFFLVNCEAGLVALRVRVASRSDLKLLEVVRNWSLGLLECNGGARR